MQVFALGMLALPSAMLTIPWVMAAQALSGIAKDLQQDECQELNQDFGAGWATRCPCISGSRFWPGLRMRLKGRLLYWWFAALNHWFPIRSACDGGCANTGLHRRCGELREWQTWVRRKPSLSSNRSSLSLNPSISCRRRASVFLFGARDVWFVIALPIYLGSVFGWDHSWVGGFLAADRHTALYKA